ncbi:thiamine-phosphate kinase [Amorphus coralli]|uniref:thiamine-phosphate kinase n=1 Tax=Amorphus coralli TaxID=340680 RepID=UPI000364B6A1|nr:thiamine-phosphate kinase [Amorphus coralli]
MTDDDRPGEFELIERYLAPLATDKGAAGLKDDAAIVHPNTRTDIVLTKDALAAGVHFFLDDPAGTIAAKALRVNLSDLAAKGADAFGYLMALALPADWTEEWLAAFVEGLAADQARYGVTLLGGDTLKASGGLTVSITALGRLPEGAIVRRSGARPGDRLFVTGTIGDAALGLALRLEPELADRWRLSAEAQAHLADRYLLPQPRTAAARAVRTHAHAALDVSDGLCGDMKRMAKASGVAMRVDAQRIPLSSAVATAVAMEPEALGRALRGGDDYEIVAAVPAADAESFVAEIRDAGLAVEEIGVVEEGAGVRIDGRDGEPLDLGAGAFHHF